VIPGALSIITKAYADPTERAHVIGSWAQTVRFSDMGKVIGRLDAQTMRAITQQMAVVLGFGGSTGRRRPAAG
jgi:hypothetical protein